MIESLEHLRSILYKKICKYCNDPYVKDEVVSLVLLDVMTNHQSNFNEIYKFLDKMVFFNLTKFLRKEKTYVKYKTIFAREIYSTPSPEPKSEVVKVTKEQQEIIQKINNGESFSQIAKEMKVSRNTVPARLQRPDPNAELVTMCFYLR